VAAMPGCFSTWFNTVVLPLPRNPVSTVTGMREAASLNAIEWPFSVAGPTFPRNAFAVEGERKFLKSRYSNCRTGKKARFPAYDRGGRPRMRPDSRGEVMYPLFYWTGLATFVVWAVLSAFSAVHGF